MVNVMHSKHLMRPRYILRRVTNPVRRSYLETQARVTGADHHHAVASYVHHTAELAPHVELQHSSIARYTSIGRFSRLERADVGPFCSLSWNVTVGWIDHTTTTATTHDFPVSPRSQFFVGTDNRTHPTVAVGADVWIGCNAVIFPGVNVGHGSIIGAGAIVTRDVDSYTIVAGMPARPLRRRCTPEIAERLCIIAWWNWPEEAIEENIGVFRRPINDHTLDLLEDVRHSYT